ncbi:MAG: glycosyltransferase family 4 protein, partial [Chloroflexi bacterium]|nr:glycosyltransferase family 4 protein [Chloroflexota bacterium]
MRTGARLRIRHVLPALGRVPRDLRHEGPSGLVGIALGLALTQAARGHLVELHGWRPGAGPERYSLHGVSVRVTPGWGWAHTSRVDGRVLAPLLAYSAASRQASIAHVHTEPHLLLAPRARRRVLHYQTPVPASPPRTYRWLVERADAILCCSGFVRDQVLARLDLPAERVEVLHGGIDLRPYADIGPTPDVRSRQAWGIGADETALLFVGAVVPEKGLRELLQSLREVRRTRPELSWRLLIAGNAGLWATIDSAASQADPYTEETRALSRDLPITWLGLVAHDDMPRLYGAVDAVVCPSIWDDPFPTINLEAMAAGRAVVGSRVGGVPEAVLDGVTGRLVPPRDRRLL